MKRNFILLIICFLITADYSSTAQGKSFTISGKVTSFEESYAFESVNISIKGTDHNTGTQADGRFCIDVAPENSILVLSSGAIKRWKLVLTVKNKTTLF